MYKPKFFSATPAQLDRRVSKIKLLSVKPMTRRGGLICSLAVLCLAGGLAGASALPAHFQVTVDKGGGTLVELNLSQYSIRSADFRVVSWNNANGYVVEHSPTNNLMPVRTYRGYVTQDPNELVTAIIDVDNTLDATVHDGSGRRWTVSNVDVSGLLGGGPPPALATTGVPITNSPPPTGSGSQAPPGAAFMPPVNLYSAHGVYDIPSSQYKGSVDASLAWLEYQWNIHDFFNSRDGKLNILLTEVFVRKAQFYFPANGNWSQFNSMLRTEWLAQGINTRGFIGSAFPTGFSYAGGYAVGNNFYNTGGEAICVNALYHENAHNWGAQHYYYGVDTMSGSYPAHGEMNVARVLNNRNREIGEGGPVLTTNAVSLVHPYAYVDIVTTLTNSPVNIAPLANDWDANGETLSIKYFTTNTVKAGTVTKSGNVLTYTPASGYVGKDIIVYEVQDTAGLFSQELIHIEVVNQGLAAHWAFEDASGQTAMDSSGHGHAGTLSGATFGAGTVVGPVGNAISLATGQYMVCDNTDLVAEPETAYPVDSTASNFFDPMDRGFTLTCWFKLGDASQTATLFTKRNPGFFGYILTASSSGLSTTVRPWDGNGSSYTVSGGSISAINWYHAAMVINRTNHTLRLYLNGVEVGTAATLPSDKFIFNGREDLRMGGGGPVRLDEAQIHSKALTPAEIAALYASGTPPATEAGEPSPANDAFNVASTAQLSWQAGGASNQFDLYFGTDAAAFAAATTNSPLYKGRISPLTFNPGHLGVANTYYWRVDVVPPSGPVLPGDVWHFTTADSPLTANLLVHLTLDDADLSDTNVQDIALAADNFGNDGATSGQVGRIGQAFAFNGSNSVVQSINADIIPASSGGTMSLWLKTTNTTSGTYLLNIEGAWVLQYQGGGVLAFLDGSSSGNGTYGAGLNNGNWHHVLAANDGTTTRVYVDGAQAGSYAEVIYNLDSLPGRQTAVGVAYSGSGNFFTGAIDDVGIWSRGLSAAEASLIYSNGLAGRSLEREVQIAGTSFEAAEGLTGYVSPNFAALNTKTNTADGSIWTGLAGDVQIWNRSDIPPDGVQCLKIGESSSDALCRVRFPGTNHGVGVVFFDYAAFSSGTDADFSLSYSNATSGGWVEVWTTHLTGNNPPWETKPWPTVSIPINVAGDVDLLLKKVGAKGVLVDNFHLTSKSNYPPAFAFSPFTRPNGTSGVAYSATMNGEAYDPSAFDTLTFSKVGGPAWLNVATNGALTGTPTGGDSGTNTFIVRVTDSTGLSSDATLLIYIGVGPGSLMAGAVPNPGYTKFWSWLAADNSSSPNGAGADANAAVVTRWDDVRGAFDHDLGRNSGGGGIFYTNRVNGLPAINYTGTRNNWGAFSTAGEFQTMTNGYTLLLVARVNAPLPATGYLFDGSAGNGRIGLRSTGSPQKWQLHAFRSAAPAINVTTNTVNVTTNVWQVHVVQVSGTNMTHYLNGALAGAGTFSDGGTPLPMSGLILSCDAAVANHLECDVPEVLAYNEALSTGDRNALENYLLTKYALVLPPPNAPVITPSLSGGNLLMPVNSQSGYTYVLQSATNLNAPVAWIGVTTNAGTGGVLNFSAPVNPAQPQNYFRVVAY